MTARQRIAARDVTPDYDVVPFRTFDECFSALEDGSVDLAMIPVENSTAGRGADIHHLLPQSKSNITGEYFLPIRHQLLGLPGTTLDQVKQVRSHPQALDQCR